MMDQSIVSKQNISIGDLLGGSRNHGYLQTDGPLSSSNIS